MSASGTFCGDSGRSIFLEQHLEVRGTRNYFRWEIPYPYIHQIEAETEAGVAEAEKSTTPVAPHAAKAASACSRESMGGAPSILPFSQRPKTA